MLARFVREKWDGASHLPPTSLRGITRANSPPSKATRYAHVRSSCGKLWGVFLFRWRHSVCLLMIAILPVSFRLKIKIPQLAMLRSDGVGVLVNKSPAPASIALFSDDLIETQKTAVARIEASGSAADINSETMVQFEGNELVLDHGSLSVNTSRGMTSARGLPHDHAREQRRMDSLRRCRPQWESERISA